MWLRLRVASTPSPYLFVFDISDSNIICVCDASSARASGVNANTHTAYAWECIFIFDSATGPALHLVAHHLCVHSLNRPLVSFNLNMKLKYSSLKLNYFVRLTWAHSANDKCWSATFI